MKKQYLNKIILICVIALTLMLTGCGPARKHPDLDKPKEIKNPTEYTEYVEMIKNDVTAIHGADIVDGKFKEPLSFELSKEEISEIISLLDDAGVRRGRTGFSCVYRLILFDENENILDEWMIDSIRRITTSNDLLFESDELEERIKQLEVQHELTNDLLWNRMPGDNYFALLKDIDFAVIDEITDTNFDPEVEYTLNEEEVEMLRQLADSTIVFSEERDLGQDDAWYMIHMYDKHGAGPYIFHVDADGTVDSNGWKFESEEVYDFLRTIEESSGLNATVHREFCTVEAIYDNHITIKNVYGEYYDVSKYYDFDNAYRYDYKVGDKVLLIYVNERELAGDGHYNVHVRAVYPDSVEIKFPALQDE